MVLRHSLLSLVFFLLLWTEGIFDDIFVLRHEDLALPEGERGECEEDDPHRAHGDSHDEVPDEEPFEVENIAKNTDGSDPAN